MNEIPNERLCIIMSNLDETELWTCKLVCNKWSEIFRIIYEKLTYNFIYNKKTINHILKYICEKNKIISFKILLENIIS